MKTGLLTLLRFGMLPLLVLGVALLAYYKDDTATPSENIDSQDREDQGWRASEFSKEMPFSIEHLPAHPFLAQYDRRITFRSGKHIGLWFGTGSKNAFWVYLLGTNTYYLVDEGMSRNEYRVDVDKETVECKCGSSTWVRIPEGALSVSGHSSDGITVKTESGEVAVNEGVPVGDALRNRRFICKVYPSGKIDRDDCAQDILNEKVRWMSVGGTAAIPFFVEWHDSITNGVWTRIKFKSGKTVGVMGSYRKNAQNVYRMQNGMFLLSSRKGTSLERLYRIDVKEEVVFCAYDGRWVRVPDESLDIEAISAEAAIDDHPVRTVISVLTKSGRTEAYGVEPTGNPFEGVEYVGTLHPDGKIDRIKK